MAKEVKVPHCSSIKENRSNSDDQLLLKENSSFMYEQENRPPPPEYPKRNKSRELKSQMAVNEKFNLSKSQPDLSKVGISKMGGDLVAFRKGANALRSRIDGREEQSVSKGESESWSSSDMIDVLMKENTALKNELDTFYQKVAKTQKVGKHIRL